MAALTTPRTQRTPGDVLLHPVALAALVVLVLNDHVLKGHGVGVVTGKLSDIAGLVFFPLLVVALIEGGRKLARSETWTLTEHALAVAVGVTAVVFTAVKASPTVADWYSHALSALAFRPLMVRADLTDLLALPALAVAWFVGRRFVSRAA